MKTILSMIMLTLTMVSFSQADSTRANDTTTYRFYLNNGGELIGKIKKSDPREILILTTDGREVIVPQYEIKKIDAVKETDFNEAGDFIGDDKFATRYFITTNGLPMKKGEHYVQWNLYGPDFQFAVGKNFGMGVMTSWMGMPILLNAKYSFKLADKVQFAVGAVGGSGTWTFPDWGGVLPYGTLSFGSRKANLAISGGYGAVWANGDLQGRALTSLAGMVKVSPKISLVFDSFILLPSTEEKLFYEYDPITGTDRYVKKKYRTDLLGLVIPGIRWHQAEGQAFQFGFTGVVMDDDLLPVPIPMVQWYRSL